MMPYRARQRHRRQPDERCRDRGKFIANAAPVIGAEPAKQAAELVWALEQQKDMRGLIALIA